jgi:hypothetical protein
MLEVIEKKMAHSQRQTVQQIEDASRADQMHQMHHNRLVYSMQ